MFLFRKPMCRYDALPSGRRYNVSVTGLDEQSRVVVTANGIVAFNGTVTHVWEDGVWTLPVPPEATKAGGDLLLSFTGVRDIGTRTAGTLGFYDDGQGIKLAEVWLRVMA